MLASMTTPTSKTLGAKACLCWLFLGGIVGCNSGAPAPPTFASDAGQANAGAETRATTPLTQPSASGPTAASGAPPAHQPLAWAPGYGPPRGASNCAGCGLVRVLLGSDEVLLCGHPPKSPIKPHNARGAIRREIVEACDAGCCPH